MCEEVVTGIKTYFLPKPPIVKQESTWYHDVREDKKLRGNSSKNWSNCYKCKKMAKYLESPDSKYHERYHSNYKRQPRCKQFEPGGRKHHEYRDTYDDNGHPYNVKKGDHDYKKSKNNYYFQRKKHCY